MNYQNQKIKLQSSYNRYFSFILTMIQWSFLFILLIVNESFCVTFNIANGDTSALISAINIANKNKQTDIINLAPNGIYSLSRIVYTSSGKNTTGNASERGLPTILNDTIGLDLTINGNNATVLRASDAPLFGIFDIAGQTLIKDLTIKNGNVNAQGAAIFVEFKGNLELINCKFFDNVSFLNAEGGGGAVYTKSLSILKVTDCHFENNSAANQGGAISNLLSNLYITNSTFKNNKTDNTAGQGDAGGAIYDDGVRGDNGEIVIRKCTFESNLCIGGLGGAMFLFPYNKGSVEVTDCVFKNNQADQGGAYWHSGGSVTIRDSEYPHTYAPNTDAHTLLLRDCYFEGNSSTSNGGALSFFKGEMVAPISSCTFRSNKSNLGGAICAFNKLPISIQSSTFHGNIADQGGAIAMLPQSVTSNIDLTNCTFDNNIANQYGGAITVPQNTTPVNVTNCTFANNQANNPGNGQSGAIHSGKNTPKNETVTIKNNIFYNNTVTNPWKTWKHCNCELNDGGNNLFFPENANGRCVANPQIIDPLVGMLSENGGPTQTIPLLVGSPAIDAGSQCPMFDQRGFGRVGGCDIGAFEYNAQSLITASPIEGKAKLNIYPNPTETGRFSIQIPQVLTGKDVEINIYNSLGEVLKSLAKTQIESEELVDIGNAKGLLIIELKNNETSYFSKIFSF